MASERAYVNRSEPVSGGKKAGALKRQQGSDTVYDQVVATRDADSQIGNAAVAGGATATLVSFTVPDAPALWRFWGFRVWTSGLGEPQDAKAWVEIGGVEIDADELFAGRRIAAVRLPAPVPVANGLTVALKVRNRGASSVTYIGKLLGD